MGDSATVTAEERMKELQGKRTLRQRITDISPAMRGHIFAGAGYSSGSATA